ncbi:MAG: NAD(P)-binding domain-containing protein [Armatimonadota bacterium]|nr:NAD(P)-binding domain-containing protein [Armatimonadota bacterium]
MAQLNGRPHPPGRYPVVVVGSGPGGLQISYFLQRLGVPHATLSADAGPGGMFLRYPLFQRLNTWSKPYAPAERGTRPYEWYDWNSLVGDVPEHRSLVSAAMDGTSYFPSREEMARGLAAFAERAGVVVRYTCRWEATRREGDAFVLATSDGEYRCRYAVFAVGMAEPWKPPQIPGIEAAPHYVEIGPARTYAGRRVFIIGKRNSGFEIADALLPWARQIILGSPRPPLLSVLSSGAGVRAKYLVPYEDHVIGGGVFVLDAAIDRVERSGATWRVVTSGMEGGTRSFEVDEVFVATGFTVPLGDLPSLGVATFNQGRLPRMNDYWESTSVPGIYFAGTITQGSVGLRKYGGAGNSAAVGGFRHNARVLAVRLARLLGIEVPRPRLRPEEVVPYLLSEATRAPELLNQKAYLARVVSFDRDQGILDEGIVPLAAFVDEPGPDAAGIVVEVDRDGQHHPAVYLRHRGHVSEHALPPDPLLNFEGREHQAQLAALLAGVI